MEKKVPRKVAALNTHTISDLRTADGAALASVRACDPLYYVTDRLEVEEVDIAIHAHVPDEDKPDVMEWVVRSESLRDGEDGFVERTMSEDTLDLSRLFLSHYNAERYMLGRKRVIVESELKEIDRKLATKK